MSFFDNAVSYSGTALLVVLLYLLMRGPLGRYFPLFLYLLTYLMSSLAEAWGFRTYGYDSVQYRQIYWGGELLVDLLLFFLVIALTLRALEGAPVRGPVMRFLLIVTAVVLALPWVAFESRVFSTRWNNLVAELFNFGAAIMSLGLWTALLVSKRRDRQLLTVTAGLGFAVAGAAMTMAVRRYTANESVSREAIDFVHRLLFIASELIWCWAFWPHRKAAEPQSQ